MNKDCPFCALAKEKGRILKEGRYCYVIFSNPRLMPGHLLIIPKRHVEGRLQDLSKEERDEILDFLVEYQTKILGKISSGCDIRQNYKPYAENSRTHVNHLHFHLNPREYKDELYEKADIYRDPLYRDLPEEEIQRISDLLK